MLASKKNGTLYVGVTNDVERRIQEHKDKASPGFTKRYNVTILVHYEAYEDMYTAIEREKQLKGGSRKQKLTLIEEGNREWKDLFNSL